MTKAHKISAAGIALAMALSLASCGTTDRFEESCPAEARFAAVWSSEQSSSMLTFHDETGPIGKKRIDVKGFVPGHDFVKTDDEWIGVSNGSKWDGRVHIVRINPTTCQVTRTKVEESNLWDYAADSRGVYLVTNPGPVSELHFHSTTGEHLHATIAEDLAEVITATNDELLILSSKLDEPPKYTLRVFDKATLEAKWKIDLPVASVSATARVVGDTLYFAEPFTASEAPGNQLVAVNLKTKQVTRTDLLGKLPYVLDTNGSTLYVGNTFMNPSFGPLEQMRTITAVDLGTGKQELLTADHGISHLRATKDRLVVYGDHDSENNVAVTSYRMPQFKPEYSLKLKRPAGKGQVYGAGFLLLDES